MIRKYVIVILCILITLCLYSEDSEPYYDDEFDLGPMGPPMEYNVIDNQLSERTITEADHDLLKMIFPVTSPIKTANDGTMTFTAKKITFPIASSSLPNDKYGNYEPKNISDSNYYTSWVEGKKGPGIGEWIAMDSNHGGSHLTFYNGWGEDYNIWKQNNRVKKAQIHIFIYTFVKRTGEYMVEIQKPVIAGTVEIADDFDMAYTMIPYISSSKANSRYIIVLEILSVYKGTKYNDTCFAEMGLDVMQ